MKFGLGMKRPFLDSERTFDYFLLMWYNTSERNDFMKGYCGIDCQSCAGYLATINNDDRMRMDTAIKWSRMFKITVLPREVNCTGCQSEGVRFKNSETCKIRQLHHMQKVANG